MTRVSKTLKIPEPLLDKVKAAHSQLPPGWKSLHDFMLGLLETGLLTHQVDATRKQAQDMADMLTGMLKGGETTP